MVHFIMKALYNQIPNVSMKGFSNQYGLFSPRYNWEILWSRSCAYVRYELIIICKLIKFHITTFFVFHLHNIMFWRFISNLFFQWIFIFPKFLVFWNFTSMNWVLKCNKSILGFRICVFITRHSKARIFFNSTIVSPTVRLFH